MNEEYQLFIDEVVESLKKIFGVRYNIKVNRIPKNNGIVRHGICIIEQNVTVGMFIFMSKNTISCGNVQEVLKNAHAKEILIHEYGHTIQSVILGPVFIFAIGIPSLVWAHHPYYKNKRKKENISYLSAWQERWASSLGKAVVKLLEQDRN